MTPKLFLANLPYRLTEAELKSLFAAIGPVVSVHLPLDQTTGRVRGIGFVEMQTADLATEAIARLHDQEVGGRRIVVAASNPPPRRTPSSRRY